MRRSTGAIAAACLASATLMLPAVASARTKTVYADAPPSAQKVLSHYAASVNSFFLAKVTINQGDSVKFINGGFHTIDFPGPSGKDEPLIVSGPSVSGDKDAAGQLFWFNGKEPSLGINPALLGRSGPSTYDGSKRVESGLPLGPPKPFKLKFTKPGNYKYFCDAHPGMIGYVVVKATGRKVPSTKQDATALAKQVKTAEKTAKKLANAKPAAGKVSLGSAGSGGVEDYAMFPAKLKVHKGAVVAFFIPKTSRELHTASFGPKAYLKKLVKSLTGPSPLQQAWYPSDDPAFGAPVVSPKIHGNGFANTGLLDRDPATKTILPSGKLKFTKAGTYHFICLIHPFMRGTIIVK